MLGTEGEGQRLRPLVCDALTPLPMTLPVPYQCSITTVTSSIPLPPLVSFSRFSATATAASAFRFLPREAMAPGARRGTEPTKGGNRVETRARSSGQSRAERQTAGQKLRWRNKTSPRGRKRGAGRTRGPEAGPPGTATRHASGGRYGAPDQTIARGHEGRTQQGRGLRSSDYRHGFSVTARPANRVCYGPAPPQNLLPGTCRPIPNQVHNLTLGLGKPAFPNSSPVLGTNSAQW